MFKRTIQDEWRNRKSPPCTMFTFRAAMVVKDTVTKHVLDVSKLFSTVLPLMVIEACDIFHKDDNVFPSYLAIFPNTPLKVTMDMMYGYVTEYLETHGCELIKEGPRNFIYEYVDASHENFYSYPDGFFPREYFGYLACVDEYVKTSAWIISKGELKHLDAQVIPLQTIRTLFFKHMIREDYYRSMHLDDQEEGGKAERIVDDEGNTMAIEGWEHKYALEDPPDLWEEVDEEPAAKRAKK
jgi:hypothetical protein